MSQLKVTLCFHEDAGHVTNQALSDITQTLESYHFVVSHLNLADIDKESIKDHFKKTDIVLAYGGDGTVHHVLQHLLEMNSPPIYGIIPGGTANDFARTLNMPINPMKAAEVIGQLKTEKIDIGEFNNHYFLNFFGLGLVTETKQAVSASSTKELLGRFSYYLNSLRSLNNPKPFHLNLRSNTKNYDGDAIMVMVGNGQYTGGVRAFFNQADTSDGAFDVLIIKDASARSLFDIVKANITPDPEQLEGIDYFRATELEIDTTPTQPIDCDGEDGGVTPATLKILPQRLTMLTGR